MRAATAARRPDTEGSLRHWLWTLPIFFFVTGLSIQQIDLYPPRVDEFGSMYVSGRIAGGPYSPVDVLRDVERYPPVHPPLSFLELNLWGHVAGHSIALARVLTIFYALLALAVLYRLVRDNIAPAAGIFALAIFASNVFYSYFIAHARTYPLLVPTAALVLWQYLQIARPGSDTGWGRYLAFGLACLALAITHAFSALLFITRAIYHLLFVPKNRRWLMLPAVTASALLIILPWIWIMLSKGIGVTFQFWEQGAASLSEVLEAWLTVTFNGNPILLAISLLAGLIAIWLGTIAPKPYLLLSAIFVAALALTAHFFDSLSAGSMRLSLAGWPPLLLFLAAGLYGLYRWRKPLGLLVLRWVASGWQFQQNADLAPYLGWRLPTMRYPPWHRIASIVAQSDAGDPVYGIGFSDTIFRQREWVNYSQYDYYFGRHRISVQSIKDFQAFKVEARAKAIIQPDFWVFYQISRLTSDERSSLPAVLDVLQYQPCEATALGADTILMRFGWKTLNCQPIEVVATHATDLVAQEFYGHFVDVAAGKLSFADRWSARREFDREHFLLSIQVISDDWRNEAQVDVPLVHEGELRQFSIDISGAPPGSYRLMAIFYDSRTGEQFPWNDNAGPAPGMRELTRVDIPER